MVGAIAGALYGMSNLPTKYLKLISETNGLDIEGLAHKIEEVYYV